LRELFQIQGSSCEDVSSHFSIQEAKCPMHPFTLTRETLTPQLFFLTFCPPFSILLNILVRNTYYHAATVFFYTERRLQAGI